MVVYTTTMNKTAVKTWQKQRNIGPVMAELLAAADLTITDLKRLSVEEFFFKFWACHPHPRYAHSAYLYALHGAKYNCDWLALPDQEKAHYRQFIKDFKASW